MESNYKSLLIGVLFFVLLVIGNVLGIYMDRYQDALYSVECQSHYIEELERDDEYRALIRT